MSTQAIFSAMPPERHPANGQTLGLEMVELGRLLCDIVSAAVHQRHAHIETVRLPARSPNLNAHAERWVRSVKDECLSKTIPFGERSLRRAMKDYIAHYHTERNHQGKNNLLLFHRINKTDHGNPVRCRDRLGGLLRYYHQEAA